MLLLRGARVLREYESPSAETRRGRNGTTATGARPKGRYRIDWRSDDSKFHRAIHVSYPNERDVEFAQRAGLEVGGGVMIHGLRPARRGRRRAERVTTGRTAVSPCPTTRWRKSGARG